jgi:hypothetical protein
MRDCLVDGKRRDWLMESFSRTVLCGLGGLIMSGWQMGRSVPANSLPLNCAHSGPVIQVVNDPGVPGTENEVDDNYGSQVQCPVSHL